MKTTPFPKEDEGKIHRINIWHFIARPPNFPNQIKNISYFLQMLETSLNLETSSNWPWGVQSNKKPSTLPQILSASGSIFQTSELTRMLPLVFKDDRYYFRIFFIASNEVTKLIKLFSLCTHDKFPAILVLQQAATDFTCNKPSLSDHLHLFTQGRIKPASLHISESRKEKHLT